MSNGKGDAPRPLSVNPKAFADNWERTFGTNKKRIEQKIQELQEDINVIKEKLDNCEYSGLPAPSSYVQEER